jgi:hypothetical protein
MKVKLKDWAEQNNMNYLTANRKFHAGQIPGAYQESSGIIMVDLDKKANNNDVLSYFLLKTVEFSKSNSSVEEFAAFVIGNFQLKFNKTGLDNNESEKSTRVKATNPDAQQAQISEWYKSQFPSQEKQQELKQIKELIKNSKQKYSTEEFENHLREFKESEKMYDDIEDYLTNHSEITEQEKSIIDNLHQMDLKAGLEKIQQFAKYIENPIINTNEKPTFNDRSFYRVSEIEQLNKLANSITFPQGLQEVENKNTDF